jgi:hypothetical protein
MSSRRLHVLGQSGRVSGTALVALAVLLVGLAVWATSWHREAPSNGARSAAGARHSATLDSTAGEAAIDQALALTGRDSMAIKSRWLDFVHGVDLAALGEPRRGLFLRFVNAERCTCGCGYTLAGCRASDMSCDVSGPRIEALLDSVRSGKIRSARGLRERPAGG